MMNVEQWLDQYGYGAVFLGVFLEGPLTLTMAGFLVHQEYLSGAGVLLTAFAATFLVVELLYFIGLVAGQYLLEKWPALRKHHSRFAKLLERYKALFIIGFRFVYGTQVTASIIIGIGRIGPGYFTAMNAVGAAAWTVAMFLVGYFFGHAFELLIEDLKRYEKPLSLVLVAAGLVYYLARRLLWRKIPAGET